MSAVAFILFLIWMRLERIAEALERRPVRPRRRRHNARDGASPKISTEQA